MTTSLRLALLAACAATFGGCILPTPHVKRTCGPVCGKVIDAGSKAPIPEAEVRIVYPDGGERTATTDSAGAFGFSTKYRFHYALVFGVALNYSLPYDCGWWDFGYIIISANGYRPAAFMPWRRPAPGYYRHVEELDRYDLIHPRPDRPMKDSPHPRSWRYPAIELQRLSASAPST